MVQSGTRLYLLCILQHPFTSSKAPKESKPEITKSMTRSFNICVSFVSISDRVQPENKDLNVCFFRAQCWFISTANCISHHLGFEQVFIACNIFLLLFGGWPLVINSNFLLTSTSASLTQMEFMLSLLLNLDLLLLSSKISFLNWVYYIPKPLRQSCFHFPTMQA